MQQHKVKGCQLLRAALLPGTCCMLHVRLLHHLRCAACGLLLWSIICTGSWLCRRPLVVVKARACAHQHCMPICAPPSTCYCSSRGCAVAAPSEACLAEGGCCWGNGQCCRWYWFCCLGADASCKQGYCSRLLLGCCWNSVLPASSVHACCVDAACMATIAAVVSYAAGMRPCSSYCCCCCMSVPTGWLCLIMLQVAISGTWLCRHGVWLFQVHSVAHQHIHAL